MALVIKQKLKSPVPLHTHKLPSLNECTNGILVTGYEDDDVYEPDPMYAQVRKPRVKRVCIQFKILVYNLE